MTVPDFQSVMLPLLQTVAGGKEITLRNAIDQLAVKFLLTQEQLQALLPSGRQAIFDNRIGWAKTHLVKAGLLESPRRSYFKITTRGQQVLDSHPSTINVNFLRRYAEYSEFIKPSTSAKDDNGDQKLEQQVVQATATPDEILEAAYQGLRNTLADELLEKIKSASPVFFERLVVELLVKMGYGGSIKDAGRATRYTGDGGIDGIIKEDKLGLDVIYIQAKRWENNTVGRPDVQSFVGALEGQRANKGVFITTSRFADTAVQYVGTISKKVVLIDGPQLANLMIDYNLGVSSSVVYELKKMDNDYFTE